MRVVRVYLAGGFHTPWDLKVMTAVQAREPNKFFFLNPRSGWTEKSSGIHLTDEEKEVIDKAEDDFPTYWNVDALAVKSCDVMFANLEDYRPKLMGPGVILELGMAYAFRIPAVVVNQVDHRYYRAISKLFDPARTLDEGIEKLLQYSWLV